LGLIGTLGFDVILLEGDIANPVVRFHVPMLSNGASAQRQLEINMDDN
jgi:hypothetical protein